MRIYGLCDPRSGELRYVGKTVASLNTRLAQHICSSLSHEMTHKSSWIKSLNKLGLRPEVFLIEECDGNGAEQEIHHIAALRALGCNLTNHSPGGEGRSGWSQTEDAVAKRVAARKAAGSYKHSDETREKMRAIVAARPPMSAETRAKIKATQALIKERPWLARGKATRKGRPQPQSPEQRAVINKGIARYQAEQRAAKFFDVLVRTQLKIKNRACR